MVERSDVDPDVRVARVEVGDGRAAFSAEASLGELGGGIGLEFALGQAEGGARESHRRAEQAARVPAAHCAVAKVAMDRRRLRLVSNGAAEAAAGDGNVLRHRLIPPGQHVPVIRPARYSASAPTPSAESSADLTVYMRRSPRKYRPGTSVTPRFCAGSPVSANTGHSTQPRSYRYPVAQTTATMPAPARSSSASAGFLPFGTTSNAASSGRSRPVYST